MIDYFVCDFIGGQIVLSGIDDKEFEYCEFCNIKHL